MKYTLNAFYEALSLSKQAVHQSRMRQIRFDNELENLVIHADLLKEEHPGCGVEKMYYTLMPEYVGRDKFCEIFLPLGYGVKKVKNYRRTTYTAHMSYPNLIERMQLTRPYQVVQSDITYFYLHGRYYYLIFIIDVYTREIVGYNVSNNMRTEANIKSIRKALRTMNFKSGELIHHSDRGAQYASNAYTGLLKKNGIHVSMGLIATDNAYAERVNGIKKKSGQRYVGKYKKPKAKSQQPTAKNQKPKAKSQKLTAKNQQPKINRLQILLIQKQFPRFNPQKKNSSPSKHPLVEDSF